MVLVLDVELLNSQNLLKDSKKLFVITVNNHAQKIFLAGCFYEMEQSAGHGELGTGAGD